MNEGLSAMSLTILDIAMKAGTSKSTVSRYLNGDRVSPQTAENIRRVIRRTGYSPNVNARRLVKNQSFMLGVIFDDIANYTYGGMLDGVQKAARARGYNPLFLSRASDQRQETDFLQLITSSMVDGLIFITLGRRQAEPTRRLRESGLPIVLVGDGGGEAGLPRVDVDNREGTRREVQYLIRQGHRRIAYLKGPDDMPAAHAREEGYRAALSEGGLPFDPALLVQTPWSVQEAYRAVRALAEKESFTALVASNAYSAYGSFQALCDAGLNVPGDVAVAGFDDDPLCEYVRPGITTMRQPISAMGAAAVEKLIARIDGDQEDTAPLRIQPELIERGSTKINQEGERN